MPSSPVSAVVAAAAASTRRVAVGRAAPAVFEILFVGGLQVGGVDFLESDSGAIRVPARWHFRRGGVPRVRWSWRAMRGRSRGRRRGPWLGPGVGVEHGELAFGGEQRLVVVRAVQVHEVIAEALEQGQGDRGIVDELAVGGLADHPAHDELGVLAGRQAAVFEDGVDFARVAEFEHGLHRAGVLAGADQRFVGAFAEHQFERADDDGLAGTGFAGDADQARAEFPGEFIDEGQIADFEQGEHAWCGTWRMMQGSPPESITGGKFSHRPASATAQSNARLALMLAIGELQQSAGPDQGSPRPPPPLRQS